VAARTRRLGGVVAVGTDLSRSTRVIGEGRFESVDAKLPIVRTRVLADAVRRRPIPFDVQEGSSRVASLGATIDVDTRSDPVLPRHGGRLALSLHTATPLVGSSYSYARGVLHASRYLPAARGHVLGFHGFAGAIYGEAPYFDQFFVGDLNLLLAPRALGINFATLPSRDFLGTAVEERRYGNYAARLLVEYAIPILRRRGFVYRGDAFIACGAFALASEDELRARDGSLWRATGADLTGDVGVRLDTYVGIFTLSVANALGRIPF
jgi:outer membrane protein insertion porin family